MNARVRFRQKNKAMEKRVQAANEENLPKVGFEPTQPKLEHLECSPLTARAPRLYTSKGNF